MIAPMSTRFNRTRRIPRAEWRVVADITNSQAKSVMTYKLYLRRPYKSFSISCPDLPGCLYQEDTGGREALAYIAEADKEYFIRAARLAGYLRLTE